MPGPILGNIKEKEVDAYVMTQAQAQKEQRSPKKGQKFIIIQEEEQLPPKNEKLKNMWNK